jgi:hypothetical protein
MNYLSRRQFLAAMTLSGYPLAAFAQGRQSFRHNIAHLEPHQPPAQSLVLAKEPSLYLPSTSGGATSLRFANTPHWARNTPGWFIPSSVSAGACMLLFPQIRFLPNLIKSFHDLPELLDQARALGTSAIYLVDWFEGQPGEPRINYWMNKGDYIPRLDLGGEPAFKEGIAAVHARGGRVIVYVEGFIISKKSVVGRKHGAEWSIIAESTHSPPEEPYPGTWKPCPGAEGWVAYVESVARRIGEYGADGIFFDSYGFQKDWKCISKEHGHPIGDPEVFDNGCVNVVRRARAALHASNPEAIILTEGPTMERLFEYTDGSLDAGMYSLVTRWLWDAQGKTDTITSSFSLDDLHQILAIGAKIGCPVQFFNAPPASSAQEFLNEFLKQDLPEKREDLKHIAYHAFWGIHAWRNAGLILGLPMPGLDDVLPRPWERKAHAHSGDLFSTAGRLREVLEGARPRIAAIDEALAGRQPPAQAEYIKTLLTARAELAPFIDYGSSVELVRTQFPRVVGWRFTSKNGMALTAVNVGDFHHKVNFPNISGTWKDGVRGNVFIAESNILTVTMPPHGVRLLATTSGEHLRGSS